MALAGFGLLSAAWAAPQALAIQTPAFSQAELTSSLRTALDQAVQTSVSRLGVRDGFLGDPKVRISLPRKIREAARLAQRLGLGSKVEALETGMNRAAEAAIPRIRSTLKAAAGRVTIRDALKILTGGESALTDHFRAQTESDLQNALTPIVAEELAKLDLVASWNDLLQRIGPQGQDMRLETHVVRGALSGLYLAIGEEERSIRKNPARLTSGIARKVFGAVN
jgi:hypothetical protein